VAARLRPALEALPPDTLVSDVFPFQEEEIERVAKTEPTLRDMLQQFRRLFDQRVYGSPPTEATLVRDLPPPPASTLPAEVKHVLVMETTPTAAEVPPALTARQSLPPADAPPKPTWLDLWTQQLAVSRAQLEPEGALTGATRELQAGLGLLLLTAFEHGVKVGPWRLKHVVAELTFGEHPTYGSLSIGHWAGKTGQPWRLGVGLFLGRGPGKLKDLQTKLAAFEMTPPVVDQLVLLRPADDITLSGKSKTLWDEAVQQGRGLRLEPVSLEDLAVLYGFPRWLTAMHETHGATGSLPNLADFLQEQCAPLLGQLSMPATT
jgi:hypothetical protein